MNVPASSDSTFENTADSSKPDSSTDNPAKRRGLSVDEAFFDLYDRMLGDVQIPAVLRQVADVACQDLGAERASVFLVNEDTQELESAAMVGNVARTIRVPISSTSLIGHCAVSGQAFVVPDAYGDLSPIDPQLRFDRSWDRMNDFRTRDVMCAPALFKDKAVGVVQVINSKGAPFCASDLPALRTLSRLVGYTLYHARLYDDLATLKQLEKEKAQFMRIMVHELKAPVAVSKMMADALQLHDLVANTEIAAKMERISIRMGQLMELIKDLLQLASVKSGIPLGDVTVIDMVAETRLTCQQYDAQAQQKGLSLEVTLPDDPVCIRLDRQGCALILSNLISNAVKYTQAGFVRVTLRRDDRWAVLEVADSGMGIPEADVPKLFNEFFRASNARRSDIEGTGVGLAGAKALVERFGGQFTLQTRENEGSTFTVRLPLHIE